MKSSRLLLSLTAAALALGLTFVTAQEPPPQAPAPEPAGEAPATPEAPAPEEAPRAPEEDELRRLDEPTPPAAEGEDAGADAAADAEAAASAAEAGAADAEDHAEAAAQAAEEAVEATEEEAEAASHNHHRELVRFGTTILLPAGESAGEVVSIFGDVVADGTIHGSSVAVMGDNTTNGGAHDVVAVFGNVTVNGEIQGEVVAVFGNVQLGPNAVVHGEVVCVGGRVDRAPGAEVHRGVQQVGPFPIVGDGLHGLRTWFRTCLALARPLAFHPDLLWAWGIAFAFVGVYLFIALIFNRPVIACAETLEQRPGMTIVASILGAVGTPILVILLSFIGIGLLLIPVLFFVGLFGKTVFLAWLGRRITLPLGWSHSIGAVLIGGIILLLLYTIPIVGFLVMKVSGGVGFGMAVYTAILALRRPPAAPVVPPASPVSPDQPSGAIPPVPAPGVPPVMSSSSSSGFEAGSVSAAPGAAPAGPTPVVPPAPSYVPPPLASTPVQFSTLPRAGFWIRLGASLLDLILIAIVLNFVNLTTAWPLLFGIYCVVLWALRGTTIGGIICGLKVVRLDDRRLDWPAAVVRSLGGYLSLAVLGLGFVWVAFDPERQSWHDKIAGTTIVRVPKGVTLV